MEDYKIIVAENIKKLRDQRKLSLDKAAKLTGISKSMIAQIEKAEVSPSMSTMWKLANGFKISFTELMSTPETEVEIIKKADRTPLVEDDGKFRNYPIVYFDPSKRFETYLVETDENGHLEAEPHPDGTQEYVTVIGGELKLTISGKSYILKKEETMRFRANCTHSYENAGQGMCRFYIIIYYSEAK